ncbi:MAG: hypothetical protein JXR34_09590, partial [Bacteroidales bacterium]|nr:hypothetical protein [Bacteroidales bacterium]
QGKQLVIASSGDALIVLKNEFPKADFVELPDYKIRYYSSLFLINALRNFANVNRAVRLEKKLIAKLLLDSDFDLIISDNAYGCCHSAVKSVLITHQVEPSLPIKNSVLRRFVVRAFKNRYLKPFSEIWVPDFEGQQNLSGALSHNLNCSKPIFFIGPQSRFKELSIQVLEIKYEVLVILSGPEPARSLFENQILYLFRNIPFKVAIVRGKAEIIDSQFDKVDVFGLVDAAQLFNLINQSKLVICRAGYSSLMDLFLLKKKALIVPTPGQPEQEYLAEYHQNSELFTSVTQNDLSLEIIIEQISKSGL